MKLFNTKTLCLVALVAASSMFGTPNAYDTYYAEHFTTQDPIELEAATYEALLQQENPSVVCTQDSLEEDLSFLRSEDGSFVRSYDESMFSGKTYYFNNFSNPCFVRVQNNNNNK